MIKIGTVEQLRTFEDTLPKELYTHCFSILSVLDDAYGYDRNIELDLGGFLTILYEPIEFVEFELNNLNLFKDIPEVVDIFTVDKETFYSVIYILGSDFSIIIVSNEKNIPKTLVDKWSVL